MRILVTLAGTIATQCRMAPVLLCCLTSHDFQHGHVCRLWKLGQWYVGYSFKKQKGQEN